jgi:hypothetical protein
MQQKQIAFGAQQLGQCPAAGGSDILGAPIPDGAAHRSGLAFLFAIACCSLTHIGWGYMALQ